MSRDYREVRDDLNKKLADIVKEIPDSHKAFSQLAKAAHTDGALTNKEKELIALAIGITQRCQGCLAFHAKALVELGCTRREFLEMIQVAMYMGGGPAMMTSAEAIKAYEDFGGEKG